MSETISMEYLANLSARLAKAEAQVQAVRELYEFYRTSPVNECSQTDLLGEIARVLGGDA